MTLVGTFTEEQVRKGEDKSERDRVERESGGVLRYFIAKFRRVKGVIVMSVYAMSIDEYKNSKYI